MGEAYRAFERVPPEACGALVRKHADDRMIGAMLVERGRVCWAVCNDCPRRLTDILVAESDTLTVDQVNEVVATCRRERAPLGETLLRLRMVSLPELHRALLAHTCEALDHLLRHDSVPWAWVPHAQVSYNPMLTFSLMEILVGLQALIHPGRTARALETLRSVIGGPEVRGFAMERLNGVRAPVAQIGCDTLNLTSLRDLSLHADEIMAVAATTDLKVAVVESGDLAFSTWTQDDLRFVLLEDGELAFNRLLARMAGLTLTP